MRQAFIVARSLCALAILATGAPAEAQIVMGTGPGSPPVVRVITSTADFTVEPYGPLFGGGVNVAMGDVDGDGVADIITGAGPGGGPHVVVLSGRDRSVLASFFAYDPAFAGGVNVAAGDVDGDGRADIITGAGSGGGPHVQVFSGRDLSVLASFFAYHPAFGGGVYVAAGDVDGDGLAEVITGAGAGGGPHVQVIKALEVSVLASFFAYDPAFAGGVTVAAGDLNGDGLSDLITGAGPGGGPHVIAYSGLDLSYLASFYAYDPAFGGGVFVAAGDYDGDGRTDLITGAGPGGGPHVRVFSGVDFHEIDSFFASATGNGVSVGSVGDWKSLRFTSASMTTFTAASAGTFTVTTAGAPVPAITSSGTLPGGVTFVDNGDGSATLAGTPAGGTGGTYALTFTADNGTASPATQAFTLTVNEAPAITSAAATTFPIGAPGTFTVTTTGFPAPTLAIGGASLPSGVTFVDNGNGTGTLSGTPAAGTGGAYALTFTATNGSGFATHSFTLTVSGSPAITSAATTTFAVGSLGTFPVTAIGSPTPALSPTGVLPAGVTFVDNGNGTGTLSGTPAAGTGGTYAITFTAANGIPPNGVQAFTLNVHEAPAITSAASTAFSIGTPGSFSVTTSGFPAPTLAIGGTPLPSGVTFVDNGNGTGTLSGTPGAGTGGIYAITFTPTSAAGTGATQNFTLSVTQAPTITSANQTTFQVGQAGTFSVTSNGFPGGASITLGLTGTLPTGVTFTPNGDGTGTLAGTPAAGTAGAYALTFTAANGVSPDAVQAFTLTVNQAPAITSAASTTFSIGTPGSFTVTTSGFPASTLAIGGTPLPSGVSFVDNGDGTGTLSGTPAAGTGGTYAITFTPTSAAGTGATQNFTLTVNQAPTITSANQTTFQVGQAGTFAVTSTGFPGGAAITLGLTGTLPTGVTFTPNGDGTGTLAGTPAAGTAGAYALTFTAANGVSPDDVQAFTLNVQEAPAITSVASTTFTVGTPGTFTVTTTGFPAPTVTQSGTLPTGVTFTAPTLGGTATQTGAFPLVFTAANGVPPDATQNFTLNVVCPTITVTPLVMPDGLYQTAYVGVDFNQTGSTGSSFTWGATGLPAGLTIDATTGVVSGTATSTVLNGTVVVTVTDNFGCVGTANTTITVRPMTDNESYTGGVGHTQFAVGVTGIVTPHVFVSDNVKTGDNGPGALSVTFPATSTSGAILEGGTDGTFVYTPNLNFGGPSDSFTYTLTDGNGVTNTGTVTIALSNIVWYVNSSVGNGDGRSHNPFNTLASAATASSTGSIIYVHTGGATTPGDLPMDANQALHGQGAPFALNSLTIASGARPTLTGTVTLANTTSVTAVNFTPGGIPAMTASAVTQPIIIDQVNVTGGTNALSLTNVSGSVTVTNANFTNTTGAEVLISQGTGTVNIAAVISSNAGRSIDIQNRTGGTVTFTGGITDTGQGVFLNANTGSTINFTGGLALTTGANPGFTATGGGTVSATQNNTTILNTITTTTGTALTVANTTIGASGLTFRSLSANGAANGIVLDNTGATAGLTVTGDGTTTSVGGNASGGTISNATGADGAIGGNAVYLSSTSNVTLRRILINGTSQNHGIRGINVSNFSLEYSTVTGANGTNEGLDEGAVNFDNLLGSSAITSSLIEGGREDNLNVVNTSGTLNRLTVTASTFGFNNTTTGNNNILIEALNAGTVMNFTIQSSIIKGARADWLNAGVGASATMDIVIGGPDGSDGNSFDNLGANAHPGAAAGGNRIVTGATGTQTVDIRNNTLRGSKGGAVFVRGTGTFAGATGTVNARVRNNTIGVQATPNSGSSEGSGISIFGDGGSDMTVVVTQNTIYQYNNHGIQLTFGDELNDGSVFNVAVTGNTVSNPGNINSDFNAIHLNNGTVAATDTFTSCVDIGGAGGLSNNVTGGGQGTVSPNNNDVRLRQRQSTTVRLPGYAGANSDNTAVQAYLSGRNVLSTVAAANSVPTGGGYVGGAACAVPIFP